MKYNSYFHRGQNPNTKKQIKEDPCSLPLLLGLSQQFPAAVAGLPCAVKNKPPYTRSESQGEMSSNMQRKRGNTLLSICLKSVGEMQITLCTQEKYDLALTIK